MHVRRVWEEGAHGEEAHSGRFFAAGRRSVAGRAQRADVRVARGRARRVPGRPVPVLVRAQQPAPPSGPRAARALRRGGARRRARRTLLLEQLVRTHVAPEQAAGGIPAQRGLGGALRAHPDRSRRRPLRAEPRGQRGGARSAAGERRPRCGPAQARVRAGMQAGQRHRAARVERGQDPADGGGLPRRAARHRVRRAPVRGTH